MKNKLLYSLLGLFLFLNLGSDAWAIDQVKLTSGEVVEGTILSDVPNRHVDIQLVNGTKRRYSRNEVASVERDVPSNKDLDLYGNDSRAYFGLAVGGSKILSQSNTDVLFNYGARFGANMTQWGDFAKVAFGLAFNRSSQETAGIKTSYNELMVQVLLRRVSNSGFYFGPQFGLNFITTSVAAISTTTNKFNWGAVGGYDYYINESFSMGPEVHFTAFDAAGTQSMLKVLLTGTFHL